MADQVRAKFRVVSVEGQTTKLQAVVGGSPEDNTYAAATPWGELTLGITNPAVEGFFVVNGFYYLDITPAERREGTSEQ